MLQFHQLLLSLHAGNPGRTDPKVSIKVLVQQEYTLHVDLRGLNCRDIKVDIFGGIPITSLSLD